MSPFWYTNLKVTLTQIGSNPNPNLEATLTLIGSNPNPKMEVTPTLKWK